MSAMLGVVSGAPRGLSGEDVGAYFKSIDGIVEHMAWAIVLWLQRYSGFGSYHCLATSRLVTTPIDATRDAVRGDGAKAAALLMEASSLLTRFISDLPEEELERRVRYRATDGKELERTFWHTIFQVLNHGTHHRGEISAILDMHGVANDYNSFVSYVS